MAILKIRLRFNPGREGSPMDKLGEFASQTERFLRSMVNDMGLDAQKGKWLARRFGNESVSFDGEYSDDVPDAVVAKADSALEKLSSDSPMDACNLNLVGFETLAEFAKVGRVLDADETYYVGLYRNGHDEVTDWRPVSHRQTTELRRLLETPVTMLGSVQGIIHSWHKGADPQFFQLRELITGALVRCEYEGHLYSRVHRAMSAPKLVVHVHGRIEWDSVSNSIIRILMDDIEPADPLGDMDFQRFFGSAPQYTGDFSTGSYIAWLRGDDE